MATNDPGIPVNCDLQRRRGDTWPLAIQLLQSGTTDPLFSGGIAGFSFKLAVDTEKEPDGSASSATNLFEITGTITDAAANKIEFAPSDGQADQTPGTYYYEIEMTDLSSDRRTLMEGKWVVKQDRAKGA